MDNQKDNKPLAYSVNRLVIVMITIAALLYLYQSFINNERISFEFFLSVPTAYAIIIASPNKSTDKIISKHNKNKQNLDDRQNSENSQDD